MTSIAGQAPELTRREKGFVCRIMAKYPGGQHRGGQLYRSIAIFAGMLLAAHVIEQTVPTWWLPLLIIAPPAAWLFSRYRRFSIFRSCVLSKVAARLALYEPLAPAATDADPHHSAARAAGSPPQSAETQSPVTLPG
jgi:hypothetical protein